MPLTRDIVATYGGPGRVVRRLLDMGQREDRALAFLMAFCVIAFVAQMPRLSRQAHQDNSELNELLIPTLYACLFFLPLIFYVLAGLSHLVARLFGGQGNGYGARLALFWALLASSPLMLLNGLVAGLIGPGPGLQGVGLIWLVVFVWFWMSGLRQSQRQVS